MSSQMLGPERKKKNWTAKKLKTIEQFKKWSECSKHPTEKTLAKRKCLKWRRNSRKRSNKQLDLPCNVKCESAKNKNANKEKERRRNVRKLKRNSSRRLSRKGRQGLNRKSKTTSTGLTRKLLSCSQ